MREEMKRLYDAANTDLKEARRLQDEYKGKDMPADVETQVENLLDNVQATDEKAERLEKRIALEDRLNATDPLTPTATAMPEGVKVMYGGRELSDWEVKRYQAITPFGSFLPVGDRGAYGEYKAALVHYMVEGKKDLSKDETKALSVGIGPEGGFLVQDTFLQQLLVGAGEVSAMRRLSNVLPPVPSGSVIVPTEDNLFTDATWTTELDNGVLDVVQPFGQLRLSPKPFAKRLYVSRTLMRNPTFDIESYVRNRFGVKFGVTEENGFLNGIGALQPVGLLQTAGMPTWITAAPNVVDSDDVIDWVYALPAAYANSPKTRILSNRALIRKIRQLQDGGGNYVWQPGLQIGMPGRILDVQYETSDRFDDGLDANDVWEDNAIVGVIGDFSYFWIVDALQMEIQTLTETRAAQNQVEYIGRKESDGAAVLPEAFVALSIRP